MEEVLSAFKQVPRFHLLGFSQGAATATRWASQWEGSLDSLILWGGGFAHDLVLEVAKEKFAATEVILVHGLEDKLVTEESKKRQEELILDLGKPLNVLTFSGGHEIDPKTVERIINQGF